MSPRHKHPLRILCLEDDLGSFELVRALLEAEHFGAEVRHVDDATGYRTALITHPPDLILADFNLPTIDGLTALDLRRSICPHVPFIFLSGALGEENAIALLHQGATDFILKDAIMRLPAAITRALAESRTQAERAEAERALRESEARYRRYTENAPDILFRFAVTPAPGHYEFVSSAVHAILGYNPQDFYSDARLARAIAHPDDRVILEAIATNHTVPTDAIEVRWIHRDGHEVVTEQRFVPVRDDVGNLVAVEGIARDITARKRAGERLNILSEAIAQSPVAVEITDRDNRIIFVNPRLTEMCGYSADELIGRKPGIFASGQTPRATYDDLWATLGRGETWRGEFINRRKDGALYHVRTTITPIRDARGATEQYLAVKEDVTASKAEQEHRRKLEAQLVQAQKLETIGTLAGGIAHDFNNILTGILGFAQMATFSIEKGHPAHSDLQEVYAAALRARDLVAQILTFSRRSEARRRPVDLSNVVGEAVKFLRASAPATIEIERHLEPGLVLADPTQMHQVVLNLATNAIQAMRSGPGKLLLEVRRVEPPAAHSFLIGTLAAGPHIQISVTDTGPGIDEQTLQRIFDPFFTTKPQGEGTGLGLSLVQGIVAAHEGAIDVHSTVGTGTRFEIHLPLCTGDAQTIADSSPVPAGTGQHIMIVDDERPIATYLGLRLKKLGYQTTVLNDPREALALILHGSSTFHGIITDLTMPHLTGLDLLRQVRAGGIQLASILTSGNPGVISPTDIASLPGLSIAAKPFDSDDLARTLHKLLAKHDEPAALAGAPTPARSDRA